MFRYYITFTLALLELSYTIATHTESKLGNPVVLLTQGEVEGKSVRYDLRSLDRFIAIPYAQAPVGDLRFQPPVKHPGWGTETYDASGNLGTDLKSKTCMQSKLNSDLLEGTIGSEDCLYMNVWIPGGVEEARKQPLPVMVWIHGDGYSYGSSWGPNVHGERLFDMAPISLYGDIIGVSFNYRLGPFGFLSTGDDVSRGNYGMLDQVMALQWVQENIWAFGGLSDQVTLFGQGTGGTSVSFHMMSPMSADLFARGISESGSALAQWSLKTDPWNSAVQLADALNCPNETTDALVNCLKSKPAEEVTQAVPVYGLRKKKNLDIPWGPVVDGVFLPSRPESLIANAAKKSYLLGTNSLEGHRFASFDFPLVNVPIVPMTQLSLFRAARIINDNIIFEMSRSIDYQYQKYAAGRDRQFYKDAIVDLYTDYMYTAPAHILAQQHYFLARNRSTGASTFLYVFSEPRSRSILQLDRKLDGAEHGQELQYVYDVPDRAPLRYSRKEQDLAKAMMLYWTNFAWTGNPNNGKSKNDVPAVWPTYDVSSKQYLDINTEIYDRGQDAIGQAYRGNYNAFWGRIIPQIWGSDMGLCQQLKVPEPDLWTLDEMENELLFENSHYSDPYIPDLPIQVKGECEAGDLIRPTSYGCVNGEFTTWNGYALVKYQGIPYATPPLGTLRFSKPEVPEGWSGLRESMTTQKICPQYPFDPSTMSEDCLYLDVYVPLDTTLPYDYVIPGRYAVMVWLHGGGFMTGDGIRSFSGEVLTASENIIVVTLNYRLGSLGFLSTGNRYSQGNYGLWDQNLAMQWVRDNIAEFGGDPQRVTIFGQGAGAESAQLHTISGALASRQLGFNRTILQSGTVVNFDNHPDQVEMAKLLGEQANCGGMSDSNMVACLRALPVEDVINAQAQLQFAPVVDGSFISRDPNSRDILSLRQLRNWEYMIGVTSGDGTPYWSDVEATDSAEKFRENIKQSYQSKYGVASDDIQFQYSDWNDPYFDQNILKMQQHLFSLYTDQQYVAPANKVALKISSLLTDVFVYYLAYPYQNEAQMKYPSWTGVMHGGDLPYVWGDIVRTQASEGNNPDAALLSYDMMKYWANFAKTGDPNKDENGDAVAVEWPRYTSRFREYIHLDAGSSLEAKSYMRGKEVSFWNIMLPTLEISCPLYLP